MDSNKKPAPPPPAKKPFEVPLHMPLARKAAQGSPVQLPPVTAPSLEDLSVTVPQPPPITLEQIQERFQDMARAFATERMRPRTEPIALSDEVLLNVMGYCNGQLIPFSVRSNLWIPLEPASQMPGLYEQIAGHFVGESLLLETILGEEYPVAALRGQHARFAVELLGAREVTYPDPANPEFLKALGRGETLEEATRSVLQDLQREAVQLALLQGQTMVLDEVAARTQVDIPEELIDEEVRRRWGAMEGPTMSDLKLNDKQQEESLQTWLSNDSLRAEARQRLRISLALGAICTRDKITLTPEKAQEYLESEAKAMGVTVQQIAASLRSDKQQIARIEQAAWHLMAVDYVMSKAQVKYEGLQGA